MSEVVPRQGFISIGWKLSILEHFKIVDFNHFYRCQALCAGEIGMKQLSYTFQILFSYKPRSQVVPR